MSDTPWEQLCEAIMKERDPEKLLALVDELNRALERRTNLSRDAKHSNRIDIGA